MSDYEFIDYYDLPPAPAGTLASALLGKASDDAVEGHFLHSVYFTTDPNVVVVAPKNGPFTVPPSKQQERFCYEFDGISKGQALYLDESFDGGGDWYFAQAWRHLSVEKAADFIREWIVTA